VKPPWAIANYFGAPGPAEAPRAAPPALVEAGNSTLIAWLSGQSATDHSARSRPYRDSLDGDMFGELPARSSGSNRETRTPAARNVVLMTALQEGTMGRKRRAPPAPSMKPVVPPKPPALLARSKAAAAFVPSPQMRAQAPVPTKPVPAPKPAWLLDRAKAGVHAPAPLPLANTALPPSAGSANRVGLHEQTMSQALRTALQLRAGGESFAEFKARLPDKAIYPHLADAGGQRPHAPQVASATVPRTLPVKEAGPAPAQPLHRSALPTDLLAEIRARGQAAPVRRILDVEPTRVASAMEDFYQRALINIGSGETSLARQASSSDSGIGSGPDDDASDHGWDP